MCNRLKQTSLSVRLGHTDLTEPSQLSTENIKKGTTTLNASIHCDNVTYNLLANKL